MNKNTRTQAEVIAELNLRCIELSQKPDYQYDSEYRKAVDKRNRLMKEEKENV